MLQSALEQEDYEVLIATSGEKALERVALIIPDLILLDIMMPGMDGYETCLQLKAHKTTRDVPVIFLSALSDTFDKVRAFSIGGVDYLTKPVEPEELLVRVKTHIRINQLEKELLDSNRRLEERVNERTAELVRVNASLREREELFRNIFHSAPLGILLLNRDGTVLIANRAAVEVYGTPDQATLDGVNLFQDPNFHKNFLSQVLSRDLVESENLYDFSLIQAKRLYKTRKTGSMYYHVIVSSLYASAENEKTGYVLMIQDITSRKRMERTGL
jgi:PAS domain S-box-containing protein